MMPAVLVRAVIVLAYDLRILYISSIICNKYYIYFILYTCIYKRRAIFVETVPYMYMYSQPFACYQLTLLF